MSIYWYEWALLSLAGLGALYVVVFIYPAAWRQYRETFREMGAALHEGREQERRARQAMHDLCVWMLCNGCTSLEQVSMGFYEHGAKEGVFW